MFIRAPVQKFSHQPWEVGMTITNPYKSDKKVRLREEGTHASCCSGAGTRTMLCWPRSKVLSTYSQIQQQLRVPSSLLVLSDTLHCYCQYNPTP